MNIRDFKVMLCAKTLMLAVVPLTATQAIAAEYWLETGPAAVMGVPMWGYALCGTGSTAPVSCAGTVTVPGPALTVPPGEGLIVHLKNNLTVPTSLVIHGQITAMTPVWVEPALIRNPDPAAASGEPTISNPNAGNVYAAGVRPTGNLTAVVRSFTTETAPAATGVYTWPNLKPGTYLYQSGTQQQIQVQMGLYGAMTKDSGAGNVAYSQGTTNIVYNNQVTLLYSEIDPALHAAIIDGTYGTAPGPTSTLDYAPKYFLVNGKPYVSATNPGPIATVPSNQNTLVRFLNAGLKTHVPTINGQHWKMIAEDGNPYPYLTSPREQYTAFLSAGKTMDVLLKPTNSSASATVRYAIFDSRHFDTNNGASDGGLLSYLDVSPSPPAAPTFDSAPVTTGTVGVPYTYPAHATDPNGDLVTYSLNAVIPAGMTIVSATGLINWTPAAAGTYPVSVRASDGVLFSNQAFNVIVAPGSVGNQPPMAVNDIYTAVAHPLNSGLNQIVAAPGVLANDTDPDGGALRAFPVGPVPSRIIFNSNNLGGFTVSPLGTSSNPTTTTVTFAYQARDLANANSPTNATVTVNFVANRAPVAVADAFTAPRCTVGIFSCRTTGSGAYVPLSVNLASNDTDPDTQTIDVANQLPLAVARARPGTSGNGNTASSSTAHNGTVTISGSNITYVPARNFTGTDTFQYKVKDKLGLESSAWATVTITVQ